MIGRLEVIPVPGLPEIRAGDDLGRLIAGAAGSDGLRDGDVVVVTQKAVSKTEGRVVPEDRGREAWVARETRRVVARRDDLVIAETSHGFVCANAGVDASNVAEGFVSLLPEDPDGSARRIRDELAAVGRQVAVVVTDTFGRPWRRGLVNVAIGCAGIPSLVDLRGTPDAGGRILEATVVAVADEVAAAAGLVMGKADGIPAAIVRGLEAAGDLPVRAMIRPPEENLFRHGGVEGITSRRTVRAFGPGEVPREALVEAVGAAVTAPVPHGSRHRSPPWTWVVLESEVSKRALLEAMAAAWVRDLRGDGTDQATIARHLARSDEVLGRAPVLLVPFASLEAADPYPDPRRREAERDMFLLATGAGVQNLMLALHARGVASCWVSSSLFCRAETGAELGMGPEWLAMGVVAAGPSPPGGTPPRPPVDPSPVLRFR